MPVLQSCKHLLEQFAICQEEMGDKTAVSHAATAAVSQRLGKLN